MAKEHLFFSQFELLDLDLQEAAFNICFVPGLFKDFVRIPIYIHTQQTPDVASMSEIGRY